MPVSIVVGGQYGSEGKGKLVAFLAAHGRLEAAVRCGGSNAGHSYTIDGKTEVLRQVPTAVVNPKSQLFIAAGALIEPSLLLDEARRFNLSPDRLRVDRFCAIIDDEYKAREASLGLGARISSTLSGTGVATAAKVLREPTLRVAGDCETLKPFLTDVAEELNRRHDAGERIVVEGTQGFGLSLHHSCHYPYVTSRDTSAANFLSEAGLSPRCIGEIYLVIRTFPIRVAGNSGPLPDEIDWPKLTSQAGSPTALVEFTTVTHKVRRVGGFDHSDFRRAVMVNRPTSIAIHGLDYVNFQDRGKRKLADLSQRSRQFIDDITESGKVPVRFAFTGPELYDVIEC